MDVVSLHTLRQSTRFTCSSRTTAQTRPLQLWSKNDRMLSRPPGSYLISHIHENIMRRSMGVSAAVHSGRARIVSRSIQGSQGSRLPFDVAKRRPDFHRLNKLHLRVAGFFSAGQLDLLRQPFHLQRRVNVTTAHQGQDPDEEKDTAVAEEFESYEAERFRIMGRHLELMWNFNKNPKPEQCSCCHGSGRRQCQYCHSTGAMMVGHERFCSLEAGCKSCPVCDGMGAVKCFHCQGTGFRAGWLDEGCPVNPGL